MRFCKERDLIYRNVKLNLSCLSKRNTIHLIKHGKTARFSSVISSVPRKWNGNPENARGELFGPNREKNKLKYETGENSGSRNLIRLLKHDKHSSRFIKIAKCSMVIVEISGGIFIETEILSSRSRVRPFGKKGASPFSNYWGQRDGAKTNTYPDRTIYYPLSGSLTKMRPALRKQIILLYFVVFSSIIRYVCTDFPLKKTWRQSLFLYRVLFMRVGSDSSELSPSLDRCWNKENGENIFGVW